jgi:hypothetical protein
MLSLSEKSIFIHLVCNFHVSSIFKLYICSLDLCPISLDFFSHILHSPLFKRIKLKTSPLNTKNYKNGPKKYILSTMSFFFVFFGGGIFVLFGKILFYSGDYCIICDPFCIFWGEKLWGHFCFFFGFCLYFLGGFLYLVDSFLI